MSSFLQPQRPPKRPKLEDTTPLRGFSGSPSSPNRIKKERHPSPSPVSEPSTSKLVKFGVKRFAPLPPNCQSSCPEYRRNRNEWVASCANQLVALDLKIVRTLIRDDGLVIDWFSPVPVWADTLKPEPCDLATAIAQTHQANARVRLGTSSPSALKSRVQSVSPRGRSADGSLTKSAVPVSVSQPVAGPSRLGDMRMPGDADGSHSNAIILTGNKLPVPPRASSIRRAIAEKSVGPLSLSPPSTSSQIRVPPTADDDDTIILDGPPLPIRPKSPVRVVTAAVPGSSAPRSSGSYHATPVLDEPIPVGPRQPDAAAEYASTAEREMSEMTLDYLRRYVQTYESDRASLASAYARLASFSYRIHCPGGNTIRASERDPSSDSGLQHGRLDIITTLIKLPSLHCAVALSEPGDTCSGASAVANGVGQLSYDILYLGAKLGMFVVCRAVTPTKMVVHSFMLQRKEVDQEEASVEGVWPMVANVHQIVVFECT